jgi:RND family efflux transporter MFP subunit
MAAGNVEIELDGILEPSMVVELSSGVEGLLDELMVDRGDHVKKKQKVAMLESSVEHANLESAKAVANNLASIEAKKEKLRFLNLEMKRIDDLYGKMAVSKREKDQIESDRNLAQWELREQLERQTLAKLSLHQAQAIYNRRIIRSPIEGVVVQHYLSPGEYVEHQAILKLAVIDPLYIEAIAPIHYLGMLKPGMRATIIPEKPIEKDFTGKILIVDSIVDAASGTFGVRIELPNPSGEIPAGLKCKVIINQGVH